MKWHVNYRSLLGRSFVVLCSTWGLQAAGSGFGTVPALYAQEASETPQADATDVAAAQSRLKELGSNAKVTVANGKLTEIVIQDGASITAEDVALFGKLKALTKLQIFNCREFNDEMVASLTGLTQLDTLAVTNSVITDAAVQSIVEAFPNLIDLDLSSNTNMSSSVMRAISSLTKLQRLTLLQNRFNDISTRRLSKRAT
jgi:Leucine-rich repeat (LRR) protein